MITEQHVILHLSLLDGIGSATIAQVIEKKSVCGLAQLYSMSAGDIAAVYELPYIKAQAIALLLANTRILEQELELIERNGISWITSLDVDYPELLARIHMPPAVLYYKGMLRNDPCSLAIVGARAAGPYARQVIDMLVPDLVAQGITIVSGGARGADTMAHQATVDHQGRTIVVLGSGLLRLYPTGNKGLFDRVEASGGLVLSSFPLLTEPLPHNFPARNRIISGLSKGCLVVQAAQKSGARITAHYALNQGRDVFVVPGSIFDPLSQGCHELLSQGAIPVSGTADILNAWGMLMPQECQKVYQQTLAPDMPDTPESLLVKVCAQPVSFDDLQQITRLSFVELNELLFNLQLGGKIAQNSIGLWHCM